MHDGGHAATTAHDHGAVTSVPIGAGPRRAWIAAALLIALATVVSGGFLLRPTELHLPACSEPWDAAIYPWNFFWAGEALGADDGWLLFTRRFYWPDGEGLGLYTPTWVYGVLSLPFQWLGPEPASRHAAVAALLWLSSVATALLAFALARECGLGTAGALLAAALATVASGRLMNAARLNLLCTEFLLLYLWLGLRLARAPGTGRGLLLGAAASLLFLQSQPLFFQAFLASGAFALFELASRAGRGRLRACVRPLAGGAVVFALLAGPFLAKGLGELADSPALEQSAALTALGSLDLAGLVVPSGADRGAALYERAAGIAARAPSFFESSGSPDGTVSHFLGAGWIALILAGLLAGGRGARTGFLFALAMLALAAGPILRARGAALPIPGPYALLSLVPPLALEKAPERLIWLAQLGLALAAAHGLEALLRRGVDGKRRPARAALAALVCAATLAEQGETVPLRESEPRLAIPPEIAAMAGEPGDFAVLDLPFDGRRPHGEMSHCVNALAMAFGAAHERPIFFGLYPRAARKGAAELAARPLFAAIHRIERGARDGAEPPELTAAELEAARADLIALRIGAVQLHDLAADASHPVAPPRAPGEVERLRGFLRSLRPERETELRPGNGYSLTLFRF